MEKDHICKFCGKVFDSGNKLGGHTAYCSKNPKFNQTVNKLIKTCETKRLLNTKEYVLICPKCGKEFTVICTDKNFNKGKHKKFCSLKCSNSRIHSDETKQRIKESVHKYNIEHPENGYKFYIKYRTCKYCNNKYVWYSKYDLKYNDINVEFNSSNYCSKECKHNYLSQHTGGPRPKSGFGKGGWYKGFYCDSSWEFAFLLYHLDNNLYIERNKNPRKYIYNDVEYNYYPDFITDEGIIEIKGYSNDRWEAKLKYNPDIIVLYEKEMQFYLNYAKQKYGENFISLYEK